VDLSISNSHDPAGIASLLIEAALLTPLDCSPRRQCNRTRGRSSTSPVPGNACPATKLKPMTASEAGKRARLGHSSGEHG
jgi:hypothetical protein